MKVISEQAHLQQSEQVILNNTALRELTRAAAISSEGNANSIAPHGKLWAQQPRGHRHRYLTSPTLACATLSSQ